MDSLSVFITSKVPDYVHASSTDSLKCIGDVLLKNPDLYDPLKTFMNGFTLLNGD